MLHTLAPYALFMACVAVATFAQNLTGFAFAMILLGVTSVFDVASVADSANASMILTMFNTWTYFRLYKVRPPWALMRPALVAGAVFVLVGLVLLAWLSSTTVQGLRCLLGVSIVLCALALLLQTRPRATVSGAGGFAVAGGLSGLLSGLFSSPGPPIVFHMYRQPLPAELVRACLMTMFAFAAALRGAVVLVAGQISVHALVLAALSVPVAYATTRLARHTKIEVPPQVLRLVVAGLLAIAGGTLVVSAVRSGALAGG